MRIKYAEELGFNITRDDFADLRKEAQKTDELSEERLEKNSGGISTDLMAAIAAGAAIAALVASGIGTVKVGRGRGA